MLIVSALFACSSETSDTSNALTPAKGNRFYGGIFRLNETEYIRSLFPLNIVDAYSYRVATQIYEGLFKFDQSNLHVNPSLAESYDKDESGTTYTFKLRQGVKFHDDPCFPDGKGRELVASDVEYVFKRLCTPNRDNQAFHVFDGVILGAKDFYESAKAGKVPDKIEGITVKDSYTIEMKLEKPNALFLHYLARPEAFIFPKEAYDKYGVEMRIKAVGTGPFMVSSVDEDVAIILKKNPNYYGTDEFGNKLPFLEGIHINFIKDKKTELFEFRKKNLEMVYRLPTDHIIEIVDEIKNAGTNKPYFLDRQPEMQTQFFAFNNTSETFKNVNVRKAFSFAIDRERILDFVLMGEGYAPGHHGITPPSFRDKDKGYVYDIEEIYGYTFNADSARFFLSKAGYPNGKNFPKIYLDLNAEGERHVNVALEVKKQLKDVLNVELEFLVSPHAQITEKSVSGNYELIRLAWQADFPSPESFVRMLYGKDVPSEIGKPSYPNLPRYKNPKVDELYEKGLASNNTVEAYEYFRKAENLAMLDAPFIVLWYDEGYRLTQPYVKNFPNNAMQFRDFSQVYLEPADTKGSPAAK
jgi:peptide/nickel transport system substrate-binding protein